MEEDLRNGIAKALSAEFGDRYKIYAQSIEQGLRKPCFFIIHKGTEYAYLPMNRCLVSFSFEVQAVLSEKKNGGISQEAERVLCALKRIDCGDGNLNAFDLKLSTVDGGFKAGVIYQMSARFKEEAGELMEKLGINEGE